MFVNINGQRINLSNIMYYDLSGNVLWMFFNIFNDETRELDYIKFNFSSKAEAQQCIEFLDKKTKCEAFKLAN
jgi:hypothetical protein